MHSANTRIPVCFFVALSLLFLVATASPAPALAADTAETEDSGPRKAIMVGGPCAYKTYAGKARIVSVTPGPGGKDYLVRFRFQSATPVEEPFAQEDRDHTLYQDLNRKPDKAYIERNKIATDKGFPCAMRVITEGTCTPVLFEFPGMKK